MSTNFFQDALRQGMATHHFNQAQLADFLKVDPAYISRWLKGSSPRLDQMKAVLLALGWNLDRARPDYDAFQDAVQLVAGDAEGKPGRKGKAQAPKEVKEIVGLLETVAENHKRQAVPPVNCIGRVVAGTGIVDISTGKPQEVIDHLGNLFPEVDYASNEMAILRVEGTQLEPLHRQGSRLVVRQVLRPNGVPTGALVVMEDLTRPGVLHLRRLLRIEEGKAGRVDRLVGLPLVEGQEYLALRPREVRLSHVIVGALQPLV